ncbi:hypothetical protein DK28_0206055 [Peptococcaceae bacterium SCADC1_2_3]
METKVLIAEDDPVMRHILRKALEEIPDVKVVGEAGNGLEAIRLAKEIAPQVVFLDIAMPEKDGLEAAREICNASPETVIIFATAYENFTHPHHRRKNQNHGNDGSIGTKTYRQFFFSLPQGVHHQPEHGKRNTTLGQKNMQGHFEQHKRINHHDQSQGQGVREKAWRKFDKVKRMTPPLHFVFLECHVPFHAENVPFHAENVPFRTENVPFRT